jgi:hypothetical protein
MGDKRKQFFLITHHPSPITALPDAAFQLQSEQARCFHCKLHWQLQEYVLAEAVDD